MTDSSSKAPPASAASGGASTQQSLKEPTSDAQTNAQDGSKKPSDISGPAGDAVASKKKAKSPSSSRSSRSRSRSSSSSGSSRRGSVSRENKSKSNKGRNSRSPKQSSRKVVQVRLIFQTPLSMISNASMRKDFISMVRSVSLDFCLHSPLSG